MADASETRQLVDHLFRREAGKMIAVLTRLFGLHQLDMAEDVVQDAFLKASQTWIYEKIPDNPAAWLMQVAKNKAVDLVRREQRLRLISHQLAEQEDGEDAIDRFFHEQEIADSQLRMIFACCHPALQVSDQLAFTLKTVSGFGVSEIARALLSTEQAVQKRLQRARQFLLDHQIILEIPSGRDLQPRLDTVLTVLYLIFNEGYSSTHSAELIRKDLCAEAMRLCKFLSDHPAGQQPTVFALLSLMCFQASRFDSRLGKEEEIILLDGQDRATWDHQLIALGYHYLSQSSAGKTISVYHIESAIAAEHSLSPSFADTNWSRLLGLYDLLLGYKASPLVLLNRAVVLAQTEGPQPAIDAILAIPGIQSLLEQQHIYAAVLGELYLRADRPDQARDMLGKAYALTPSAAEKKLLAAKLNQANPEN